MKIEEPLVSVIIPTYNRPKYLKETLESVVKQTYPNIEIIVIDDGSPNIDALEVCENFNSATYIKIENSGGPAKPRNIGIKNSNGKYIAILDDDDLWIKTKLEQQIKILENHVDFDLTHSYCQVIDEKGCVTNSFVGKPNTPDVKHGDVSMRMIGNWTLMTSSVLFKKTMIEKVGFFNEIMPPAGEDLEYWVRCSFATKFYYIDKPLVSYRKHFNNISSNQKEYLKLPLYLKIVLKNLVAQNQLSIEKYKLLLNNICRMQIKQVNVSFYQTIKNLSRLDFLWILKGTNLKMLVYILFFKK